MSRSTLTAGLRYLRGVVAAQQYREDSDERLLHAFASHRDDCAFAVLVRRHGPMVLHVCRRVLGQEQDAEDVFQATFLVLARSAPKLRKKAALASFLHGTAYRLALSAKRAAARRRKHESRAPARPPVDPADDLSWREVRALLDEEIARLPEKYRIVFILCCLEELSRAEVAQRLGLNEGTVSSRLAMARQRLQRRLSRRGVELTAVLTAATLAGQPTSALPPVLVSSILKAAQSEGMPGLVSAPVAALINSAASRSIRSKIAVFLALVAGVAALGAVALTHREPPTPSADPPRVEAPQAAAQKSADAVTVRGRVLGPDGEPVKGTRLYWPRVPKNQPRTSEEFENMDIAERARSDADGRFRFELPRSDIQAEWLKNVSLIAVADEYGVDGVELPKEDAAPELTLRLVKDQPIEGRVISTEGKPLAGVNVRIMGVGKTRQERLDDFLAAWKQKDPRAPDKALGQLSLTMFLPQNEKSSQAVTNKDGRFRLQGAGAERMVLVRLRGPGLTPAPLLVINRAGFDPAPWNKATRDNVSPEMRRPDRPPPLYGPKIEYVAATGRGIEGTVREAGSGKPVPGYRISIHVPNGFDINAVSDPEGKYKLLGVPKLKEYLLFAQPPANSAWLPTAARTEDAAGLRALQVDVTVDRGIVVSGRILDRATGKGVRGRVRFVPLPGNTFFGKPGYDYYKHSQNERTDTEVREPGRYQLAVLPGPGVLLVQASTGQTLNPYRGAEFDAKDRERFKITESDRSFSTALENHSEYLGVENAAIVLDLAPDDVSVKCDVFVDRGQTRTIRIEDADGKPLTGTVVGGVTATWPTAMSITDAACTIFALDPKKPRRLSIFHAKRHLAATLTLRGDEKEPVVVRLERASSVVGRLLNRDGQPLAGADVNLYWLDEVREIYRMANYQPTVRTDKDGRFRLEGIMPEGEFRLGIIQGRMFFDAEPDIGTRQVKPAETLDLGNLRVKPRP